MVAQAFAALFVSVKIIAFYDLMLNLGYRMVALYDHLRYALADAIVNNVSDGPRDLNKFHLFIRHHQKTMRLNENMCLIILEKKVSEN